MENNFSSPISPSAKIFVWSQRKFEILENQKKLHILLKLKLMHRVGPNNLRAVISRALFFSKCIFQSLLTTFKKARCS